MAGTIIEQPDGTSYVVLTGEDEEQHVVNTMENDSREELGQIEYESFHHHAVFSYSLLGDPNSDDQEISDEYNYEDKKPWGGK